MVAPNYLVTCPMLEHLGLLGPDGRVQLTLQKPGGEPFTIAIRRSPPDDDSLYAFS
jgi:hypothetical protein